VANIYIDDPVCVLVQILSADKHCKSAELLLA